MHLPVDSFNMEAQIFLLILLLAVSVFTDVKWKRIPNALTYPTMAIAMAVHGFMGGASGLIYSIEGLCLGLTLLIVFYFLGMMGAGDVKLMSAVGSILGPAGVFKAFLFTAIVGGVYALVVLAYHGQLIGFMKRAALSLKLSLVTRGLAMLPNDKKESHILCYGIAIAIGTSLSMVF
jgi:prepilin peptidase CpaA